jgi:hypothetical protein
MNKAFGRTALALIGVVAFSFLVACKQEAVVTGDLTPTTGKPGGGSSFPTFDINNMPSAKYWNDLGSYEKLPPLFQFADGSSVSTADDWFGTAANDYKDGRRWEIEQILQYYEYGYMPPYDDKLTVSLDAKSTTTSAVIDLSYDSGSAGVKTATFTVSARIPTGTMPEGGYPALIECASGSTTSFSTALGDSYALIGFKVDDAAADSDSRAGIVSTLFGYDYTNNLSAPSIFMSYAWAVGRIIDALELSTPAFAGTDGKARINPKQLMITGISRWGKGAMISGAFAKSKNGTQIAVTDVGSAGCLGPAIERFISPLGLNEETARTTTQTVNNIPGRSYYMKWIPDGRALFQSSTQDTSWFTTNHTDTSQPPYSGKTGVSEPTSVVAVLKSDITSDTGFEYHPWPYEGIYNGNYWHGLQTMPEVINESPNWTCGRFKQFQDLHYGLGIDCVGGLPTRAPTGYFSTIPFDQHFLSALIVPRVMILHEGYRTIRGNPEGQFFNHLAVDEVYKFLEEQAPATYGASGPHGKISAFNALKFYFITHSYPEYEMQDTVDLANVYFGYTTSDALNALRGNDYWARYTADAFPILDPRSKHDYQKLNWARPGATPLSDKVASVEDYDWTQTTEWE